MLTTLHFKNGQLLNVIGRQGYIEIYASRENPAEGADGRGTWWEHG